MRAAPTLFGNLDPAVCSWRFVPRAQRCVRTVISVPSPAAQPTAFDMPLPGAVAAGRRLVREASPFMLRHVVLHIAAPNHHRIHLR